MHSLTAPTKIKKVKMICKCGLEYMHTNTRREKLCNTCRAQRMAKIRAAKKPGPSYNFNFGRVSSIFTWQIPL